MGDRLPSNRFDVVVLGAGAAGMMCAIEAGKRGRSVLVVDHASAPGEKIRISGGGRCNFTNLNTQPANFLSQNPSFCISALRRYRARDFVALVDAHGIAYHEKAAGQLFCDGSATQIIQLLTGEMRRHKVELRLDTAVSGVERSGDGFAVALRRSQRRREGEAAPEAAEIASGGSLVVATGGKSIPKMGATGFGYQLAQQFGLAVVEPRPALVPLTLDPPSLERLRPAVGVAVEAAARLGRTQFEDGMLFTHRGLSGPAILQISSYWREGDDLTLSLAPGVDILAELKAARAANGRQAPQTALAALLPKRLAQLITEAVPGPVRLADWPDAQLRRLEAAVNRWTLKPAGSEGYRTAEVTLGGVDSRGLDSRTMAATGVAGLYFIGEVVDVTGWLGGYNFQWAWSSGWCAGQAV
ncbi:NAD(P)/FAD-dependent oxidoreductase [Chelatococcus reniformis]|nr:NAD(P)/FAD-dependent oxidoreductase [Chelatococcus reniformis]